MTSEPKLTPTRVRVSPAPLNGIVRVPGDKSISHRAVLIAALAEGESTLAGVSAGRDVMASVRAVEQLGVAAVLAPDTAGTSMSGTVSGSIASVWGGEKVSIDCGNSGTTLRLLAGLVATRRGTTELTGDESLRSRPVDRIIEPLVQMGARCDAAHDGTRPPLAIHGGDLHGIAHESPISSAQVKSCVLLAASRASGSTTIRLPLRSRDHTERLLRVCGLDVSTMSTEQSAEVIKITPGVPRSIHVDVPGDASSAAFWWVSGPIGGGSITVEDVGINPGRIGVLSVLGDLGAVIEMTSRRVGGGEPAGRVRISGQLDRSTSIEAQRTVDALDELPVLALAGAMSAGGLTVGDAAELRVKESDRVDAIEQLFRDLQLDITTVSDGFHVEGGQRPTAGQTHSRGDHRLAMTACIAATVADGPVDVDGFECVATSYPTFLDDLVLLGGDVEVLDAVDSEQS